MREPKTYRRKPRLVRAMQYTGDNHKEIAEFCPEHLLRFDFIPLFGTEVRRAFVQTPEGEVRLSVSSWLVEGSAGEFYPVKDPIFQDTFDDMHLPEDAE